MDPSLPTLLAVRFEERMATESSRRPSVGTTPASTSQYTSAPVVALYETKSTTVKPILLGRPCHTTCPFA